MGMFHLKWEVEGDNLHMTLKNSCHSVIPGKVSEAGNISAPMHIPCLFVIAQVWTTTSVCLSMDSIVFEMTDNRIYHVTMPYLNVCNH